MAQGWRRQTTIGEPRLSELVENYRNMGYEVHVIEHQTDSSGKTCDSCYSAGAEIGEMYGDIYIRRNGDARPLEDDLF